MRVLMLVFLMALPVAAQEAKPLPPGWTLDSARCAQGSIYDPYKRACQPALACEKGQHNDGGQCVRDIPRVVDRGLFGCPTGYVQHPADPEKCALPVVTEKILARARK